MSDKVFDKIYLKKCQFIAYFRPKYVSKFQRKLLSIALSELLLSGEIPAVQHTYPRNFFACCARKPLFFLVFRPIFLVCQIRGAHKKFVEPETLDGGKG